MRKENLVERRETAGRPEADIDWNLVDKMLEADCEGTEVAARLGINPATLYRRCEREKNVNFVHYLQEKKSCGNTLLKSKQFSQAMKGDKTMLVWLGKQRLNQKEKHDHNVTGINIRPLQITISDKDHENALQEVIKQISI